MMTVRPSESPIPRGNDEKKRRERRGRRRPLTRATQITADSSLAYLVFTRPRGRILNGDSPGTH
jgi:hypothetical protein